MPAEAFERVAEIPSQTTTPSWVHPGWSTRFPWLAQATTHRGVDDFDLRFFGGSDRVGAERRMAELSQGMGFARQVLSHQVHGAEVLCHTDCAPGLLIAADADGHLTRSPGLLLAVTVADCVPVFLVAPELRAIALLHAGWRSAAAGIMEKGLLRLGSEYGVDPHDVVVHFGPSICGSCYEVGPEVFRSLKEPEPTGPSPIDLRAVLARRAVDLGVGQDHISISAHCTRCGAAPFYSHRGGDTGRQLALLGVRPTPAHADVGPEP
jgi:purine-nucleoside/S-methyl-5'-thioadenosine phosphorylase / adenosine deaminase